MDRAKASDACDAAAEALVLLEPTDPTSIVELVDRMEDMAAAFGASLDSVHPAGCAARAARAFAETGAQGLLGEIEIAFLAARALAERVPAVLETPPAKRTRKAKPTPPAKGAASAAASPESVFPLGGDEELLRDFAIRTAEHLDDADDHLLTLDASPSDFASIDAVFRAFHTIKGMAGFLALDEVSRHAHAAETLLSDARVNKTAVDRATVQDLFVAVDHMRDLVEAATGVRDETAASANEYSADSAQDIVTGSQQEGSAPASPTVAPTGSSAHSGMVRVEEIRLDALLDTIGELVIAESMVSSAIHGASGDVAFDSQVERLDKITRELQHMATSLRMVPMKATFRRMARLVRDLAHKAGKQVDFVTIGEDTELDKSVVDRIQDPLIHALRNAVDHGIESSEARVASGKSAVGRVELRAFHAGGSIHVEVSDDGHGLDFDRILDRARMTGLIGADESPDERTLSNLVFEPGFSTAERVTDVSGRGVGMDVVRRTVDELRGRIELTSVTGAGTTMSVRLPVTLAIIDGMVARVGAEKYVIPVLAIERSVRPTPSTLSTVQSHGLMLSTNDGLIPILRLHRFLGIPDAEEDPSQAVVVIINENGIRAGLLVCELLGQQQTVIKPLGEGLPDQMGVAGGAIMPDGCVGLILDASSLIRLASEQPVRTGQTE